MDKDIQLLKRISTSAEVMRGKPVIRGTRLTVQFVLGLLAHGQSIPSILEEYEGLEQDDVLACLSFAAQAVDSSSFVPLGDFA